MIVYLAGPIDFNKNKAVAEHRHQIKEYFKRFDHTWVYDPSKAWTGGPEPDQFVHWGNLAVLEQADLFVAILMRNTLTVGTILEMQQAADRNIPIVVIGDVAENSISLTALDALVYESVAELDDLWVSHLEIDAKYEEPIERRECECLALHAAHDECNCTH